MTLFQALNLQPRGRPPLHCRLYQTYLPPSCLPPSCAEYFRASSNFDDLYYYPQWVWSLINTLFVGTATMINFGIFAVGLFLWMVNRQFHFSRKKHSYDKEPLRPLTPLKKAKKKIMTPLKKARRSIINKVKKKRGATNLEDVSEREEPVEFEKLAKKERGTKSFSSFLEDVEVDDDDKLSSVSAEKANAKQKHKIKGAKDLLQLASKIEVLSYLSPEAVAEILDYVEYVDLSSNPLGKVIFDNSTLDGSLYAVISGEVTMSLSVRRNISGSGVYDDTHSFSFVCGPGEVMTSLLTLISSLTREYQLQEAFISSPIPGLIGSEVISVDINGKRTASRSVIPDGIDVQAVLSGPNTWYVFNIFSRLTLP
eukprot:CCRYP_006164-RA/>CCRYP_006164-RA protein AED:0.12 eAED:0.12 QI:220/1/1/1/0.9/0.72/11/5361/367